MSPSHDQAAVGRLKLVVAYDGASFGGWQSQVHGNTVQDQLESALRRITGQKIRVHGAGRTDAGVHALGQTAHIDLEGGRFTPARLLPAVNAVLPPQIRVMSIRAVAADFHARFSARGKVYRYRIWNAAVLPPLELSRAWHVAQPLEEARMRKVLALFEGEHDFAAFSANRGKKEDSTVRTIRSVRFSRRGPSITLDVDGNGFLYRMVRMMVGATVRCGLGRMEPTEIAQRLKVFTSEKIRFVAPAEGLFLLRVRY